MQIQILLLGYSGRVRAISLSRGTWKSLIRDPPRRKLWAISSSREIWKCQNRDLQLKVDLEGLCLEILCPGKVHQSRRSTRNSLLITEKVNRKCTVLDYIQWEQLPWYEQLQRVEEQKLPKRVMIRNVSDKSGWGQSRHTWMNEVTQVMGRMGRQRQFERERERERENNFRHRKMQCAS